MTLELEFQEIPYPISLADLQEPRVIDKLIRNGRTPTIVIHDGQMEMDTATCFIPGDASEPGTTLETDIKTAKEIALIRNELAHLT